MTEISSEEINVSTWKIPSPLGIIGSHSEGLSLLSLSALK